MLIEVFTCLVEIKPVSVVIFFSVYVIFISYSSCSYNLLFYHKMNVCYVFANSAFHNLHTISVVKSKTLSLQLKL